MITINGWIILAHPLFLDQLNKLTDAVEALKAKKPDEYQKNANTKLLAALNKLVFQTIPADPTATVYRQSTTLGEAYKYWFRAKFGNDRFRLFFRYDSTTKIIIYAWVNDATTLRTYGAKTDAYNVFKGMLKEGNPPDDWAKLLNVASDQDAVKRLQKASPPNVVERHSTSRTTGIP